MYPLDNLGDYNIVREDLYKHGGDVGKLYKSIGDTAVAEKTLALLAKGVAIGGGAVLVLGFGVQAAIKGVRFLEKRKKLIAEKHQQEQELARMAEEQPECGGCTDLDVELY